jgi:hypothetical protein
MAKRKPETTPAAPAPKATPLTILKVRRTRKHVVIHYRNGDEDHEIKSRDNPLPAFDQAIAALAPLVCQLVNLPASYVENMRASGITITDGSGNEQVTVVAAKSLDDANGPFNIATPLRLMDLPEAEGSYSPPLGADQVALIDEVVEQAKQYILGNRAQGQIEWKDDKKGDVDETDDDAQGELVEMNEAEVAVASR